MANAGEEEWPSSRGWAFPAECHGVGLHVGVEIQRAIPVAVGGAEREGASVEKRRKQQVLSTSNFLQPVKSQLQERCQVGRSSARPLLLAETFLALEISLLCSPLEGRESIAMKYVVLWLFMKTAHVTAPISWSQRMWLDFKKKRTG